MSLQSEKSWETPDVETSSDDYATRFSGQVGEWFLKIQERATLSLLSTFNASAVLDVGGGHGQSLPALLRSGTSVTVYGSSELCKARIGHYIDNASVAFAWGDLTNIPFAAQSFDVSLSYRLLPHLDGWKLLIRELTRLSRKAVIVDFPVFRSVNYFSHHLFSLKKGIERNTRPFTLFHERDIEKEFASFGFRLERRIPQFSLPMALHRAIANRPFSQASEAAFRATGLTRLFGSPVISLFVRKT